jgi:hypothetical protein
MQTLGFIELVCTIPRFGAIKRVEGCCVDQTVLHEDDEGAGDSSLRKTRSSTQVIHTQPASVE